mmetsp:Transcript_13836/g.34795  ORF Transcript_13836/g.34795 Transcript_13836/m.34795 type:complete len:272 (+) Transcript_13836:113-928(+)|eukprot:jgi/Tetstr1/436051/TSEL_024929.t1
MVQQAPNLTLTLEALGGCGAVLSAEKRAALKHSIPIKQAEAGVKSLTLWGVLTSRNGKDYLVAAATNSAIMVNGKPKYESKYYYTQDGIRWVDLETEVSPEDVERCRKLVSPLSGDPSQVYTVEEPAPAPPAPEEGSEPAEPPAPLVFELGELQRIKVMINDISEATSVMPSGYQVVTADQDIIPNNFWVPLPYPDKLESFYHMRDGPDGPPLSEDVRGSWSLHHDKFKNKATLRSMLYPGYFYYYDGAAMTFGGLYYGSGLKNTDLVFML